MAPLRCCFLHLSLMAGAFLFLSPSDIRAQAEPVVGRIPPVTKQLSTSAIAAMATPATVTILTLGPTGDTLGQGSGFLVRSNGIIVTNWHVMAGASEAIVILADGERFSRVQALDGDAAVDVALIKVPGYGLPTLAVSGSTPPTGTKVVAIGTPRGLARTVTEGIVSARRIVNGRELVQVSASISPGSSGGPVLDPRGRVFAIATSQISDGQQLNFAVPVRYALGFIPDVVRTRSLSEVFTGSSPAALAGGQPNADPDEAVISSAGSTPPVLNSGDDPRVTAFYAPAVIVPPPVRTPRPSVAGFYLLREELRWPDIRRNGMDTFRLAIFGAVVIAADRSGYMVQTSGAGEGSAFVQPFNDLNVASDGRIVVKMIGGVFHGYQTEEGIFLANRRVDNEGDVQECRIRLMAAGNALSNTNGLYQIKTSTQYYMSEGVGRRIDWTGDAAIVTANDSVFIDVTLANNMGGGSGGFLRGAIDERGSFVVEDQRGKFRLEGSIQAGSLRATWIDRRENGNYFKGELTGARQ